MKSVLKNEVFISFLSSQPLKVLHQHEGGFGRVYILESADGERFAIKTLKWEHGADRNELRKEGLKLAQIHSHPNVIKIHGIEWIDGDPYIVLPFYPASLFELLRSGKPLDPETVGSVVLQIAGGLDFLHREAQLLHLDLKPQNVLLSEDGTCLLADFGLSKYLPEPRPNGIHRELFASGVTGTVAYMSPEHFVSSRLTDKSDIFALGIMMFEMITAKHPFLKRTMEETVRSILYESPTLSWFQNRDYAATLRQICLRCLAKNPADRPPAKNVIDQINGNEKSGKEIQPFDLPGTVNRANSLGSLGDLKQAEALLEQCIAYNPWCLPARVGLAELFFAKDQIDKAIEVSHDALNIAAWCPEQSQSYVTLLVNHSFYYLTRDPEQSLKYSREAVRLNPKEWDALCNLAEACRLLARAYPEQSDKMLPEGIAAVQKGLKLNPNNPELRIVYGGLLLLKRDFQTLNPILVNLMNEVGGENIPARVLLIETLLATGQLNEVKKWIEPMFQAPALLPLAKQYQAQMESRWKELGAADNRS